MILYPALKIGNRVVKGKRDDSHVTLGASIGISNPIESSRGFTPDGTTFLNRTQALGFLKKHDRAVYNELPKAAQTSLHSEHLAEAYGIVQKPHSNKPKPVEKPEPAKEQPKAESISDKIAIVYDRGLYLYLAEKLACDFKKVYYYIPQAEPYPCSKLHPIATGIKGVERTHDFWGTIDKCDIIIFPDTYDGDLQHFLRGKGYRVFGSGKSEKIETDKVFFMECLEEVNLPLPKTYLAEGIDDLLKYLEKEGGPKWLKSNTRGDFETKKYVDMDHFGPFLTHLKAKLGRRVDTIEILVQDQIDSECEAGYDGFCVDGQFTNNCLIGYEIKDEAFVASVVETPSEIVSCVNDAFSPIFKKLGYRGAYSTEIRITKDGDPYYIDPTTRFGSPPGELMSELYSNYAQVIWDVANGELPLPEPKAKYGAQMILTSDWYKDGNEMYVEFPPKFKDNIKLMNYYREGNKSYVVPNDTEQYFGSVVAIGDTIDDAIEQCEEILKSIVCEKFAWSDEAFEEAEEVIEKGREFGIDF